MKKVLMALCILLVNSLFADSQFKGTINMVSILNSQQTIGSQSLTKGTILILLKNTFTLNSSQQWVHSNNIWLNIGNVNDYVGKANLAQAYQSQNSGQPFVVDLVDYSKLFNGVDERIPLSIAVGEW